MTVIVYRDGVMAADTASWIGDVIATTAQLKVRRTPDGGLAAAAGQVPQVQQFHDWVRNGQSGNAPFQNDEEGSFGGVLVHPDGEIIRFDHLLRRYRGAQEFAVEGCHEEFLLALMLAGQTAEEAVAMAIKHCKYAAGEVFSLRLGVHAPGS